MTDGISPSLALIADFEQAAEAAREAEEICRREAAMRIAALAEVRATAFRRLNLARSAAKAIAEAEEPESAVLLARFVIAQMLGWEEASARQEDVLDRLTPFLTALATEASRTASPATESAEKALRSFEDWYRAETGSDFYALFERYIPETPRVDF